jgi:hypothetical protein
VLAHEPSHPATADLDALSFQFAGDALSPVRRMRRVDLYDQLDELVFVLFALVPKGLGTNPVLQQRFG